MDLAALVAIGASYVQLSRVVDGIVNRISDGAAIKAPGAYLEAALRKRVQEDRAPRGPRRVQPRRRTGGGMMGVGELLTG